VTELPNENVCAAKPVMQDRFLNEESELSAPRIQDPLTFHSDGYGFRHVVHRNPATLNGPQYSLGIAVRLNQTGHEPRRVGAESVSALKERQTRLLSLLQTGPLHTPPTNPHALSRPQRGNQVSSLILSATRPAPSPNVISGRGRSAVHNP
jgi:hypothetical protein